MAAWVEPGAYVIGMIITPKTIALDTSFLVGLADNKKNFSRLRQLIGEQQLLPVVCRSQLIEMVAAGKARAVRARELLNACGVQVYELPPPNHIMEAEVFAQFEGKSLSRRGLIGRTQREAFDNLRRQIPTNIDRIPADVYEDSLIERTFNIDSMRENSQRGLPLYQATMQEMGSFRQVETSEKRGLEDIRTWFFGWHQRVKYNAYDLSVFKDKSSLDPRKCPCLMNFWNTHWTFARDSSGGVTQNDFIDMIRVGAAPYVDIFTCDTRIKDQLRKAKLPNVASVACREPEEVYASLQIR